MATDERVRRRIALSKLPELPESVNDINRSGAGAFAVRVPVAFACARLFRSTSATLEKYGQVPSQALRKSRVPATRARIRPAQ
jgi:hypothetical protein